MTGRWIALLLLLCLSGVRSDSSFEEDDDSSKEYAPVDDIDELILIDGSEDDFVELFLIDKPMRDIEELVSKHAPFLRFHEQEGGEEGFCFPHDATEYYEMRMEEDWSRKCNMNYSSIQDGEIPTYWHAQECGEHLHIAYWTFTGFNHKCDLLFGERDAWWEYIVVKVRNWETTSVMAEVMYGQKKGWYTRIPGHYDIIEGSHPVAFVGRASHGFYHDDGGTSTCCYFEDSRNPGFPDSFMRTQLNLVELKNDGTGEEWMTDPSTHYWSGVLSPTYRENWDLCGLVGCAGSFLQICETCGCHKSDIGAEPF